MLSGVVGLQSSFFYRYVILGNHRDAWAFGAVDPNSGTAALLEVLLDLHGLINATFDLIKLSSKIGSTEWVEENKEMLASRAIAYLNVDCAAGGPGFHASTTPQLDDIIKQATKKVSD
ncbi:hypothetical protein GW17_00027976 [Ensete ventricosum]|nr:hypothetical protein GW17_00027976 [Ensete ventricosum]